MTSSHRPMPTVERLFQLFSLDRETGYLTHNKKFGIKEGSIAGSKTTQGYIRVKADGHLYLAHRVVFKMENGFDPFDLEVDHINGCKSDNRPSNLRTATRNQNRQNTKAYKSNKHNAKGVWFDDRRSAYFCAVQANKVREQFGPFKSLSDAVRCYESEAKSRFGEFYPEDRV